MEQRKVWKDLPDKSTPINAEALNEIERIFTVIGENIQDFREDFRDMQSRDNETVDAVAPWTGYVTYSRIGKRINIHGILSGADPWLVENVAVINVPYFYRPNTNIFITGYTEGSALPLQYATIPDGETTRDVFYVNQKLVTKPATTGTDVIIDTFYFIE